MTDQNTNQNSESLGESLKGAGEALVAAGASLGDMVGDFTRRFKADREADTPAGAHAASSPLDDDDTVLDQVKHVVSRAREAFGQASNADEYKQASASFAGDAEHIFRDLAGSVSRAAQGAKDSDRADEARSAFDDAIAQVRATFDQAVGQVRERANSAGDDATKAESEGVIADMRNRMEGLINRVSEGFSNGNDQGSDQAADGADIIDGEVVDTDDNTANPKDDVN